MKALSPQVLGLLKEALANIYWYKNDLQSFLKATVGDASVFAGVNWEQPKHAFVAQVVEYMAIRQDRYRSDLIHLIREVCRFEDFSHLARLDDGPRRASIAENSVSALKKAVASLNLEALEEDRERAEKRRTELDSRQAGQRAFQESLARFAKEYGAFVFEKDPKRRGYQFEKFLYELFNLFGLDPRAAFKLVGEQIDGAFSFEGTDYLLEARWRAAPAQAKDLDGLEGKLRHKLDNALGLFVSVNGFTTEAVAARSGGRSVLLLMDGADLQMVVDGRVTLPELLLQKRRRASHEGEIYHTLRDNDQSTTNS